MGRHRITGVDEQTRRGTCEVCGPGATVRRDRGGWRCSPGRREVRVLPAVADVDLAWVAGLLEGEGCFTTRADGGVLVHVNMTDRDVLDRLARICGGKVNGPYSTSTRPREKPYYSWRAYGAVARELMELLHPLMGQRRQARIREVLSASS